MSPDPGQTPTAAAELVAACVALKKATTARLGIPAGMVNIGVICAFRDAEDALDRLVDAIDLDDPPSGVHDACSRDIEEARTISRTWHLAAVALADELANAGADPTSPAALAYNHARNGRHIEATAVLANNHPTSTRPTHKENPS